MDKMFPGRNAKEIKKKMMRCAVVSALIAIAAAFLVSCDSERFSGGGQQKEWVYVPEYIAIDGESVSYYDMKLSGDSIYCPVWVRDEEGRKYCGSFYKYSLADGYRALISLKWQEKVNNAYIRDFAVAEDGSIYVIVDEESEESDFGSHIENALSFCKYDPSGNLVLFRDIAKQLQEDTGNNQPDTVAVDAWGNIYIGGNSLVWIYDGEGNYQGSISIGDLESRIAGMGRGRDGKVYTACYNQSDGAHSLDAVEYTLTRLDFDSKKAGASYEGFSGNEFIPGAGKDFLVFDEGTVYRYDLSTQAREPLFDWLDCNINGFYARCLGVSEDGRIVAVYGDLLGEDIGIAVMTKTEAGQIAPKELLVLATMANNGTLQSAVSEFNRNSAEYQISIQEYYDSNGEISWADAVINLQNDIISGNCPDIIDLTGLNLEMLAKKGIFEDLDFCLEKSDVLDREDFLGSILDAYTFDGILVGIPYSFCVQTLVGRADQIGDRQGWTLEEMIAFAEAYPDKELLGQASKSTIMQDLMMFNMDYFVDWETGECSFDSGRFKSLLEFVSRYPDEVNLNTGTPATPVRIQNGEVLLTKEYAVNLNFIQVYKEMFQGNVICIGYPTMDGSGGHAITSASQAYAISSKSEAGEGAWEFIESVLTQEGNGRSMPGFPSMKGRLEAMARDTLYAGYALDEKGEPLLGEDGEWIVNEDEFGTISYGNGTVVGSNNIGESWSYTYRAAVREEVDAVLAMLDAVKAVSDTETEIMEIINEEAEAFFRGQKTVEETADIIQNRVSNYVNANR